MRPGPGRCSWRFSPSGPYGSSGSELGCELSTARRAGTGYGGTRAGERGERQRSEAGPPACSLLAGAGTVLPRRALRPEEPFGTGSLPDGSVRPARECAAVCERGKGGVGYHASFNAGWGNIVVALMFPQQSLRHFLVFIFFNLPVLPLYCL